MCAYRAFLKMIAASNLSAVLDEIISFTDSNFHEMHNFQVPRFRTMN